MKQVLILLAFALLLFAGLNCGTETPVEETGDTPAVELPRQDLFMGMLN